MKRNSNEKGAFIFGIGYEYEYLNDVQYEDQSAPNPAYEKTSNTTAILFANYGITENFSFEAIFPWRKVVNNKITYDTNQFIRKTSGFGDIIIMGRYSFLLFEDLLVMNIGGGFKLATGNLEIPDTEGNRISDNLQIGSGTVDPVFSVFTAYESINKKWLFTSNFISRISMGSNIYGYQFGDEFHYSSSISYDKNDYLFLHNKLEYIYTMRDTDQYGTRIKRERGGRWLYIVPGFGVRLGGNMILEAEFPITLYQWVNESQLISTGFIRLNLIYGIGE